MNSDEYIEKVLAVAAMAESTAVDSKDYCRVAIVLLRLRDVMMLRMRLEDKALARAHQEKMFRLR